MKMSRKFCVFLLLISSLTIAQTRIAQPVFEKIATVNSSPEWLELKEHERKDKEVFLTTVKQLFELDEQQDFKTLKTKTDELGWKHYRIQQTYQDIPIEFSQYLLHEKSGTIHKANGLVAPSLDLDPTPHFSDAAALQILLNEVNAQKYAWEDHDMETMLKSVKKKETATYCPMGELVWIDPTFENNAAQYKLAYKFDIFSIEPYERYYYYLDAQTGEILTQITRIHENNVVGNANTNYYGNVSIISESHNELFRLRETWRGEGVQTYSSNNTNYYPFINFVDEDNTWTDEDDFTGCEAHWCTEQVYDYFNGKHQHNSFDGEGSKLQSWVNFGVDYVNAFWNGSFMTYGDGDGVNYGPLTCLDVVGHEITHGITEHTAGLIYAYESGALNESFSDIFGTVIEFTKETNETDKDWYLGEDAHYGGNGFRDMSYPKGKGDPDTYLGQYWYGGNGDYGGVHTNSGVQNYWFYLLSEGGSGVNDNGNSYNVSGIGMNKAAKIAFRNLTVYLTPTSNYAAAHNGSIQAAIDLYGSNSNEVQQVRKAWCAVGVGTCDDQPEGEITVTSPNGGEVFMADNIHYITWSSVNAGGQVHIEYSLNGGATWLTIEEESTNDGVHLWTVPNVSSNLAMIRITSLEDITVFDVNDGYFTIESPLPPEPPACHEGALDLGPAVYLPTDGSSIDLSTGLPNMAYTFWDFDGSLIGTEMSVSISTIGTYIASVVDSCGDIATDSLQVLEADDGSTNVWPGDMNFDGVVDYRDLIPFGFYDGMEGLIRTNQGTEWYPHPSSDWELLQNDGANVKHIDTDGNGIIDLNDPLAITKNYSKVHNEAEPTNPIDDGLSPFQISLQATAVPDFEDGENTLHFDLVLSNAANNAITFYGGYFSINYYNPLGLVSEPQLSLEDSWLGTLNEDLFYLSHHDSVNQIMYVSITRLDRANSIGAGKIGSFSVQVNESSNGFSENLSLNFDISGVSIHNSEATNLPFGSPYSTIAFSSSTCPNNLVITPNTFLEPVHQAAHNISTNGTVHIDNSQEIVFKASEADIKHDFLVETGSVFQIDIDPCEFTGFKPAQENDAEKTATPLAFEYIVEQASKIKFEILSPSGDLIYSTDLGYHHKGKKIFKLASHILPKGRLLGVFIQNHKRHYFNFEHF